MSKNQVINLLEFLSNNYQNFSINESIANTWYEELQDYDEKEIKERLEELMSQELYQKTPPLLAKIKKGLVPIKERKDLSRQKIGCPLCSRFFNKIEDYETHYKRCSSIHYIIREEKKHFNKKLDKNSIKNLYQMSEDDFSIKYNQFLNYIYQTTTNEYEKKRIEYIFKTPASEEAKRYFNDYAKWL